MPSADTAALDELLQFVYLTPVGIVKFAADGTIDLINPAASQLLPLMSTGGDYTNLYDVIMPLLPELRQTVRQFSAVGGIILDQQHLEAQAGGTSVIISLTLKRVNESVYMAVLEDVTKSVEQARKVAADEQRFRAIFDHVRDYAIYTITLNGIVEEWNHSLERFGDWQASDVERRHFGIFFPSEAPEARDPEAILAQAKFLGSTEIEGWLVKRDGSLLWSNMIITTLPDGLGAARGFVVVARDMTERKRLEDDLKQLATVDPLTGAFNRRHGTACISAEFARRSRSGQAFVVMMLDIDRFKNINDVYGHTAGDAVLCALVRTANAKLRVLDELVRWGGEEFVIVLPGTGAEGGLVVAERLRATLGAALVPVDGGTVSFTVSIGLAVVSNDDDFDSLLKRADDALYAAKTGGRNRVILAR